MTNAPPSLRNLFAIAFAADGPFAKNNLQKLDAWLAKTAQDLDRALKNPLKDAGEIKFLNRSHSNGKDYEDIALPSAVLTENNILLLSGLRELLAVCTAHAPVALKIEFRSMDRSIVDWQTVTAAPGENGVIIEIDGKEIPLNYDSSFDKGPQAAAHPGGGGVF